jgi:hypothetical protein
MLRELWINDGTKTNQKTSKMKTAMKDMGYAKKGKPMVKKAAKKATMKKMGKKAC